MNKLIQLNATTFFQPFALVVHRSRDFLRATRNRELPCRRPALAAGLGAAALMLFSPAALHAQSGTWISDGNGNWSDTARWSGGIVADGTNNTADFSTLNITANRTVTVDTPRTISDILTRDTSGSQTWTFSGANVLTLANTNQKPQIRVLNNTATFNVVLDGVYGMRKEQAGTLVLNAANTYSGGTDINRSTLRLGNVAAIPSGAGKGDVTMNHVGGAPTLDLSTFSPTINGLNSTTNTGTINSSAGAGTSTLTVGGDNANGEFGGVIANGASRTLALTKIGTGTQSLTNVNTYTGATMINAGTLQLTGDGAISSSSSISLAGGATFDVSGVSAPPYAIGSGKTLNGSGGTGTINGDLTLDAGAALTLTYAAGTPTINVPGGTLTLNANATTVTVTGSALADGSYKLISKSGSGAVAGSVGSVTVGGAGIAGGGTPSLSISNAELYLNITGGVTVLDWGSGNGTWAVGVSGWNSGGGTTFANGNAVRFTDTYSTGNPTITLNTAVLPQGVIVNSTNHYTISGTGNIGGGAELRKLGSGALTLDVANTYTGGTELTAGTLNLKNASALGAASGTVTINGGALDNTSGGALTLANYPQAWNGNFAFSGSSDLNLGTGGVTLSGSPTVTANAGTLTVAGVISGGGLGKAGAGKLALGGNNTFTGGVTINEGEIIVNNAGALNSTTPNAVTMPNDTASKILTLNGNSITVVNLAKTGFNGPTNAVVRNNHATTPVTLTINSTSDSTYAGTITDGGAAGLSLNKIGGGNLKLGDGGTGVLDYSGDTTVSAGRVTAGRNNLFPYGAGKGNMIVEAGATLDIRDRGAMAFNGLSGGGIVDRGDPGGAPISTLTLGNNNASATFSGRIRTTHASATMHLVKTGTGTQILTGANDYRGDTTIDSGVLQIGDGGTTGSVTSTSIVNNASLVFDRSNAQTYSGIISSGGTVTKRGAGTLTLTGGNTYTGATTVQEGTLRVNTPGSLAAGSAVTVNSGATLGGSGTINGPVTVNAGGSIVAGTSAGILTLANGLNLSAGGTNVWELAANSTATPGTDFDQIVLTGGPLTLGGSSRLSIQFIGTATAPDSAEPFWQTEQSWTIISASGAASNFAAIDNGVYPAGSFTTSVEAGGIVLKFTPAAVSVPQPLITSIGGAGTTSVTVYYTNTLAGTNYTLQYNTNLSTTNWYNSGTAPAGGTSASQTDSPPAGTTQRYYRVRVTP